jgi:AhpD family alkylhydroperoxidase
MSFRQTSTMSKLDELSRKRKEAHAKLLAAKSRVYAAFLEMERAAFADGALPKKQKELIAVGISVATDCESCMQWHIEHAAASGASEREVLEAVEIGIEMAGGPGTVSARFALEVMESIFSEKRPARGPNKRIERTRKKNARR